MKKYNQDFLKLEMPDKIKVTIERLEYDGEYPLALFTSLLFSNNIKCAELLKAKYEDYIDGVLEIERNKLDDIITIRFNNEQKRLYKLCLDNRTKNPYIFSGRSNICKSHYSRTTLGTVSNDYGLGSWQSVIEYRNAEFKVDGINHQTRTNGKTDRHFVYIIKNLNNKTYKIGITSNVSSRLVALNTSFVQTGIKPNLCLLVKSCRLSKTQAMNEEKILHNSFKKSRLVGEWFDLNKMQLDSAISHIKQLKI